MKKAGLASKATLKWNYWDPSTPGALRGRTLLSASRTSQEPISIFIGEDVLMLSISGAVGKFVISGAENWFS